MNQIVINVNGTHTEIFVDGVRLETLTAFKFEVAIDSVPRIECTFNVFGKKLFNTEAVAQLVKNRMLGEGE